LHGKASLEALRRKPVQGAGYKNQAAGYKMLEIIRDSKFEIGVEVNSSIQSGRPGRAGVLAGNDEGISTEKANTA
jgi:hypothetical protein